MFSAILIFALSALSQSEGFSTFDISSYTSDASTEITAEASTDNSVGDFSFSAASTEVPAAASKPLFSASNFKVNGKAVFDARLYVNQNLGDFKNGYGLLPYGDLSVKYEAPNSEIILTTRISKNSVTEYPEDLLNELILRAYWKSFVFEAGKEKIVWGRGDKLHVLDNFNANDYTDFIIPDYLDRRLGEYMFRGIWNTPHGLRMEIVYTPIMTADRLDTKGVWTPYQVKRLREEVTGVEGALLTKSIAEYSRDSMQILTEAMFGSISKEEAQSALIDYASTYARTLYEVSRFEEQNLYPNIRKGNYGQAGIRLSGNAGAFDWALSYYFGHDKQPSINYEKYLKSKNENGGEFSLELPVLSYDMLHVFGFDGAFALGMFNFRFELGYFMTEDFKGDNPWIHNNSVQWLFGFDVDIPLHNLNLNVQTTGKVVLNNNRITKGLYRDYDVDYDLSGKFTNNKIVINLSDTFLNDRIKAEIYFVWGIERSDIFLRPQLTWNIRDSFQLILSGLYMYSPEKGEFKAFNDNDYVQIGVKYVF